MLHWAVQNITPPVDVDEVRKLVLKLRWIGREDEAEKLQRSLLEEEVVAIGSPDTD